MQLMGDNMKKIVINDKEYEVVENYNDAIDVELLQEKITDYFDGFDYIVGDWAYGKLSLKGFYESSNKKVKKMNDILIYVWLGVFVFTLLLEFCTTDLICVWFSGGALVSLILAICNVNVVIQVIACVVVAALLLAAVGVIVWLVLKNKKPAEEVVEEETAE